VLDKAKIACRSSIRDKVVKDGYVINNPGRRAVEETPCLLVAETACKKDLVQSFLIASDSRVSRQLLWGLYNGPCSLQKRICKSFDKFSAGRARNGEAGA
jgi:hypothetical protein